VRKAARTCIVELECTRDDDLVCAQLHGYINHHLRGTGRLASFARSEKISHEHARGCGRAAADVDAKQQPQPLQRAQVVAAGSDVNTPE